MHWQNGISGTTICQVNLLSRNLNTSHLDPRNPNDFHQYPAQLIEDFRYCDNIFDQILFRGVLHEIVDLYLFTPDQSEDHNG